MLKAKITMISLQVKLPRVLRWPLRSIPQQESALKALLLAGLASAQKPLLDPESHLPTYPPTLPVSPRSSFLWDPSAHGTAEEPSFQTFIAAESLYVVSPTAQEAFTDSPTPTTGLPTPPGSPQITPVHP